MAVEAATYLDELNSSYPAFDDDVPEGDDHLRLLKAVLLASFPSISGAVAATDVELSLLSGLTASAAELNKLDGFTGSVGTVTSLIWGDGLTDGGDDTTTITDTISIDKATAADIYAGTANKVITADIVETAVEEAGVLSDGATIAVPWGSFIYDSVTLAGNRELGAPSAGEPGTTRMILLKGNNATERTLTFNAVYKGSVPSLTDITSSKYYLLTIFCVSTTHFVATSIRALG